jgi:hypothetical protein
LQKRRRILPLCANLVRFLLNSILDLLKAFDDPLEAFCNRGGVFFPFVLAWCVNRLHNYGVNLVILQPICIILPLSPPVHLILD